MPLAALTAPSGPDFEFFVLFSVILLAPVVFARFRLPGLLGLLLGGYAIGPHGLGLIAAGNHTIPELGHLGLLYLMFVAGLELDLHVLGEYRRGAVLLGCLAFAIPFAGGFIVGSALGWSLSAKLLLGALASSHTLITYPTLRDAGFGGNPAVACAVGATVLTDILALIVLALVAGSETESGSAVAVLLQIGAGFAVLGVVGLVILPRAVDTALRHWGGDRVSRYLLIVVALLLMAVLAQVFGIEGIVGAFFAGLSLNRLVPNGGPSMERVEFFGTAVFVPVFLLSIGLLLQPSVMVTGTTLQLAALICLVALGGKAAACWLSGRLLGFSGGERLAMFVLTAPQAAATLAVTLIGFEIGLFGESVVNAVLVLILVSIVVSATLAERVTGQLPAAPELAPLGGKILIATGAGGPSEAAVRTATLLARPDGGHGDVLVTHAGGAALPDRPALRSIERQILRHGFDGEVRSEARELSDAVAHAVVAHKPSLVIVDDPGFDAAPGHVPLLVVRGASPDDGVVRLIADGDETSAVSAEIERRLARARTGRRPQLSWRRRAALRGRSGTRT